MSKLLTVLLLYGGQSGEHEISLISAASVLANLSTEKYHIIPVGMGKDGCLYLNDYDELRTYTAALPVTTERSKRLDSLLVNGRLAIDVDVVFPMVHGPLYEDGCLQGLLMFAHVPYVGCDVLASAICMDKDIARRLACVNGVQSARYKRLTTADITSAYLASSCKEIVADLGWPLFVKPCSMGSSVGIHKTKNMDELLYAIADASRYDESVLIEECIIGREIELAVLESEHDNHAPEVTVPGEIQVNHPDGFYSYTAKYLESDMTELVIPAQLSDILVEKLRQVAIDIFISLKGRGMARVDFFVNDKTGAIYFNEMNSLPGFTPISMYPKLWEASGLSYAALLDRLITVAMRHACVRQQLVTHYQ